MKTILQKLTDKLCELEKIREDIMELRFGTIIDTGNGYIERIINLGHDKKLRCYDVSDKRYKVYKENEYHIGEDGLKITGNPIQLHHLLWYCEEIGLPMSINCQGGFTSDFEGPQIDNKKDLSNQSEETLEAILNFITG